MSELICVPVPLNMTAAETGLYAPYRTYADPVQRVKYFKNVLITHSGFCINRGGLIPECHHDYPHQYEHYLAEASHSYQEAAEDPGRLITLDDDTVYLAIHHPWFNYYHWLCESIFRLWLVRKKLHRLTLVLPESYRHADFIRGSLEPFHLKNIYFIPDGKSLLVRNLCLPQLKPICDSYNGRHLRQVNRFYREHAAGVTVPGVERLYVSRKLASRRKVVNEAELLPLLEKFGFTVFYPEKHSFLEQVAIFSRVRWLVGEHGSGLTNLLFMPPGGAVLELHKNRTNELDHPSCLFWYMAEALDIDYFHQSCGTAGREDYFEGDYHVDPRLFEQNLIALTRKCEAV
ncbi:MAG TPA: glycosyltransferase family 61 protein [Puia sp.]|uniref:glycosyltransferase family 61 protein n=1 Tax=Puia sp. TaxID=2045100 RepID=UPI002B7D4140|nr:glycosyltransferase family 61 protein [Puia sp.]HVU98016.1 glycosyltransferase family 61 protein [Puia sp.]